MENEQLFKLMTKMYAEIQEGFKEVNSRIDNVDFRMGSLESEVKDVKTELEGFRKETNTRFDNLENKLDDIEANNADRHIIIDGELKRIKAGLSKVEIITADNWGDIARLKAMRRHKIR